MGVRSLLKPERVPVLRTELRQNQRAILGKARGHRVVVVSSSSGEAEEKYVPRQGLL